MKKTRDEFRVLLEIAGLIEGMGYKNNLRVQEIMIFYDQLKTDMCWSIVSCEVVALGLYITGGYQEFIELSSKELLDCANPEKLDATLCYEYTTRKGLKFIAENGAVRACHYKFEAEKSKCKPRSPIMEETLVYIQDYEKLHDDDEIALLQAVAEYPIAAAIYIDADFFNVGSEIYVPKKIPSKEELKSETERRKAIKKERKTLIKAGIKLPPAPASGSGLHAVVVVDFGYDEVKDKRFWWIKNSSGKKFGDNGYARVIRQSSLNDGEGSSIVRTVRPLFSRV